MLTLFLLICFGASVLGSICGIGGGIIIKPLLDAFGVLDAATVSFLSGVTVLSMTAYSVVKNKEGGEPCVDKKTGFLLAAGAASGGAAGKKVFSLVLLYYKNADKLGLIQAVCLLAVTVGTLFYTLKKERIRTMHVTDPALCFGIGFALGMVSSFLGIGGGPLNLVVLFFFFSLSAKSAAKSSLYIIFFSQCTSLVLTFLGGEIPQFELSLLFVMILGGIGGGAVGRFLNRRISEKAVGRLFIMVMSFMILISTYNIVKFKG